MNRKPQQTFIVHGEDDASANLAAALRTELGLDNVVMPEAMHAYEV